METFDLTPSEGKRIMDFRSEEIDQARSEFKDMLSTSSMSNFKESGYLIRNLPINDLSMDSVENAFQSLVMSIGDPIVHANHRSKRLVYDISPRKEDMGQELASGTQLIWHSDDAHTLKPCDYIALLCVRGDENAQTLLYKVNQAHFNRRCRDLLGEDVFCINPDKSFEGDQPIIAPIISSEDAQSLRVRYDPPFTEYPSFEHKRASEELSSIASKNKEAVILREGDLLFINNKSALHARSNFTPSFIPEKDRLLKRIIFSLKEDLTV